jgi:zona occludens toxin
MIVLVSGVPGSGKSYFAVKQLVDILKNKNSVVFSNIENFRFDRFKIMYNYYINKLSNGFFTDFECGQYVDISNDLITLGTSFFTVDNYKKLIKKYNLDGKNVYFFIDECQRYFPPFLKDVDVIYFFDYHRHYNLNIYLITQDSVKINSSIVSLVEYEIRASSPSVRFKNTFIYKRMINGDIINRFVLRFDNKISSLYSSSFVAESNNRNNFIMFLIPPVLIIFSVMLFIYFFTHFKLH